MKYVCDRSKAAKKRNEHFHLCQHQNLPFVSVTKRRKYADVAIDLISTDWLLDESMQSRIQILLEENSKVFGVSGLRCTGEGILLEKAEELAEELYDIATGVSDLPRPR